MAVAEGPSTRVGQVMFDGAMVMADAQLRLLVTTAPGRAFTEVEVATDRDRLDAEYRNRGYDAVVIVPRVALRDDDTVADITFAITEGAQAIVDHVIVVGNRRTKTSTIEQELTFRPGQPLVPPLSSRVSSGSGRSDCFDGYRSRRSLIPARRAATS